MLKINFRISKEYDKKIMKRYVLPLKGDWNWSNYVFFFYPALKEELKKIKTRKEKEKIIEVYIDKFYSKNIEILKKIKTNFKKDWRKINDKYENVLLKLLDIKNKININIICYVSICPICPRDLKGRNFSVFYKQNKKEARLTIAHEGLHFYYFYKWKLVFPKSNEKNFDGPHIIWHLSEILAVVLLNTKELQEILKMRAKSYEEYKGLKIGKLNAIKFFIDLYRKFCLKNKKRFHDFLKEAYKVAQKNRRGFMKL